MTRNISVTFLVLVAVVVVISFFTYRQQVQEVNFLDSSEKSVQISTADHERKTAASTDEKSVDPAKQKDNSKLSYQEKINREVELNKAAVEKHQLTVISGKKLYEALLKKGLTIESDLALRMQNDQMTKSDWERYSSFAVQLSSEEEIFKNGLSPNATFNELKSAFDQRTEKSGIYYGNDLLNYRYAYKDAKLDDIKKVLDTGATLPENLLEYLVDLNNVDLIAQLRDAGYNVNLGYFNDFRSMNAIELYAESLAINPYVSSSEKQISSIGKLIDLGVPLKVDDGTRDALDFLLNGALAADELESEKLLLVARELNRRGISIEASHLELLNKLKGKSPSLYAKYEGDFR